MDCEFITFSFKLKLNQYVQQGKEFLALGLKYTMEVLSQPQI